MKFGKLPPIPDDDTPWCAFDALEKGDYFPIKGYKGTCDVCRADGDFPQEFFGIYVGRNGPYHVFIPMEEVRCSTCKGIVRLVSVRCWLESYDVTIEYGEIKKNG